jgi:hypothetical protein
MCPSVNKPPAYGNRAAASALQGTSTYAAVHEEGGAMRGVVRRLMRLGAKSSRVMLLLALHLARHIAANPGLAETYWQELRDLLLSGAASSNGWGRRSGVEAPLGGPALPLLCILLALLHAACRAARCSLSPLLHVA